MDDQIAWYGKKSAFNKQRFRICQLVVIVASAVIPIVNLGLPLTNPKDPADAAFLALGITAVLGAIVTVATALSQIRIPTFRHGCYIELQGKLSRGRGSCISR